MNHQLTVPYWGMIGAQLTTDAHKEQEEMITRRGFLASALGVGAAALAAGSAVALAGCNISDEPPLTDLASTDIGDDNIVTLSVAPEQITLASDLEEAPFENYLKLRGSYELPIGSLFSPVDSSSLLVLAPGEQGGSFRTIGLLNLANGETTVLLDKPVGEQQGAIIYDARATRAAIIWVELDLGTLEWQVYVGLLTGTLVSEARVVGQGGADWEPPMLAIAAEKAYWTVMPNAVGAANMEDSRLQALKLGGKTNFATEAPYTILVSHGRMITNPLVSDGIISFVPRVDSANVYYQLTALKCVDDKPVAYTVMPQSLRVSDAVYLDGGFTFCIENNYDYAGGLSSFGTYYRRQDGRYLQVQKTPMSAPVRFKDCLIVKSIYNIVGIDLVNNKSFVIPAPTDSTDFGEVLIGWGVRSEVLTCSLRMSTSGDGTGVVVIRVFDEAPPIDTTPLVDAANAIGAAVSTT